MADLARDGRGESVLSARVVAELADEQGESPPTSFRMKALTFPLRSRALTFMPSDIHAFAPPLAMNFSPRFNETVRCP